MSALSPRRVWLAVTLAVLLAVACAVVQSPRSITLSEAELQQLVDKAFPLDRRLLDVLEVSVTRPRLRLQSDRNRIGTELQVSTRDRLFGGQWFGSLALDSGLRWEASDQTVRLAQVRVSDFRLDSGGSLARTQAERLGAVLAEKVLEDFVIYRLTPERAARLERAGVMPGTVAVTPRGVEVTLEPVPR